MKERSRLWEELAHRQMREGSGPRIPTADSGDALKPPVSEEGEGWHS